MELLLPHRCSTAAVAIEAAAAELKEQAAPCHAATGSCNHTTNWLTSGIADFAVASVGICNGTEERGGDNATEETFCLCYITFFLPITFVNKYKNDVNGSTINVKPSQLFAVSLVRAAKQRACLLPGLHCMCAEKAYFIFSSQKKLLMLKKKTKNTNIS